MARSCWYQSAELRDMFITRKSPRRNLSPIPNNFPIDSSSTHRRRSKSTSEGVNGGGLNSADNYINYNYNRRSRHNQTSNGYNLGEILDDLDVDSDSSYPFIECNDIHNNNIDSTNGISGSAGNLLAGRELIIGERIRNRTRTLSGSSDLGGGGHGGGGGSGRSSRNRRHSSDSKSKYDSRITELINVVLLTCVFVLGVLSAVFVIVCYKHGEFGMGPGSRRQFQPFPEAEQLAVIDEHYLDPPMLSPFDDFNEDNECDGENKLGKLPTFCLTSLKVIW